MDSTVKNETLNSICGRISAAFEITGETNPDFISPLTLAYVGDTVYDLYIRTYLVKNTDCTAHGLHMKAVTMVRAAAQSKAYGIISDKLSEKELSVFKRGRNSHNGTVPKSASVSDYRAATGIEALFGYLYLRGEDKRLSQLMRYVLDNLTENTTTEDK